MGQRNMMIDIEMDQQTGGYLLPEPCIFLGNIPNFPPPDIPTLITAPGNIPNLEAHQLPEPYENSMFYPTPQYHGVQHHHHHPHASSLDVGVVTPPNFYVPYVSPHGPPSQLPSSSNNGVIGLASDEYERNIHLMDSGRGPYKRKNTDGSSQYLNNPAAPSSSFTPLNTTVAASFTLPQFRGTRNPPPREVGSQRSVRNRLGGPTMDPALAHCQNNFIQGNYIGQPFPPPGSLWFDQQLSNGRTDGGPSPWSQPPSISIPYLQGSNIASGSLESGNISLQRYHETSGNRNSAAFVYPSPINPRHHYFSHHPSPPIQGARGHSTGVYPHVAPASYRIVPGSYAPQSTVHDGLEIASSHVGLVQPTGFRIYRHNQEGPVPEPTLRHRNLPHLRVMPADEVALLEVGDFYDSGNYVDHHRDMRLDIEDMSYEDLLALSERIGTVNTGLSEETLTNHLKTRIYLSSEINLEEAPPLDQETDSCTICQENYKSQEKIGILDCGHEYHTDCLKKWLFVKNVCPICKSEALAPEKKGV